MHDYSAVVLIEFFTWILENVKSINFSFGLLFSITMFSFFSRCVIAVMTSVAKGGVSDVTTVGTRRVVLVVRCSMGPFSKLIGERGQRSN